MRTLGASATLFGALLLGGCPADLGSYSVGGDGDGGGQPADLAVQSDGSGGGTDGGGAQGDLATMAGRDGGPASLACAHPLLLVAAVDATQTHGGQILRVSLAGGSPQPCAPLKGAAGGGMLPNALWTLAPVGAHYVAVAGGEDVVLLDADTDGVVFAGSLPSGYSAVDAVPWDSGFGVAYRYQNTIVGFNVWNTSGGAVASWTPSSGGGMPFPNGLLLSVTVDPFATSGQHLLAIDENSAAGVELDLAADSKKTLIDTSSSFGGAINAIYALPDGSGGGRVAWTASPSSGNDAVYFANQTGGQMQGPLRPGGGTCSRMEHAVPDPTLSDGYDVICLDSQSSDVRRFRASDQPGTPAQVLIASGSYPSYLDPLRLAVVR